ncbi:hypothetical protein EXIGLDRAFT_758449 [Exidia glandulosa HHB12029]|uniref:VWFA domain-containing protein n=1 Tax=Exidia glandulosa HHB12029 TaxID=1314781 RepID=A0A166BUG5_EXIGL|nr:hypothetical protein EXIGLDRAFT_758449 [Exidia glandulosa HHB12029]
MGSEQSAPSRSNSHSRSKSVTSATSSAASSRRNSAQGVPRASPPRPQAHRRTVRDESATADDPPPPYAPRTAGEQTQTPVPAPAPPTRTPRHGQHLAPPISPDILIAQLNIVPAPAQDMRRSSSTAAPTGPPPSRSTHRRAASLVDTPVRRPPRPAAPLATGSVDLGALETDLLSLQSALRSRGSSPNRHVSRTPSPRLRAGDNPADFLEALRTHAALSRRSSPEPRTPEASRPARSSLPARSLKEDPLVLLSKYDTIVIVDDSGSMLGERWQEARDALVGVVDAVSRYDLTGIELHFLNNPYKCNVRSSSDIEKAFCTVNPEGATPTGEKLEELLLDYMERLEASKQLTAIPAVPVKPVNFIILTDGAPTDDPETVIVTVARRLDARHFPISQVGIQFVQIGDDAGATAALQELDDELARTHGVRDIVDTTPYSGTVTAETLAKILIGGINRRVDKRGV